MTQTIGCTYAKKKKERKNFDQYFAPYQKKKKINSKWITDLHVKFKQ